MHGGLVSTVETVCLRMDVLEWRGDVVHQEL